MSTIKTRTTLTTRKTIAKGEQWAQDMYQEIQRQADLRQIDPR